MPPRILLVEDDPVSREVLTALLVARSYEVDEEADGFGALRCAQDRPHDLILIDYHLPEMDGYALARLMRTLGERSEIVPKMVAITADSFGLAARRGADNVFDRIIAKPIDPDKLYAFCDEVFPPPSVDLDAFLGDAEREGDQAPHAADVLWRVRGLAERPAVAVLPVPGEAEREALEYCFRLVAPAQADCLLLLRREGLATVERLRADASLSLQPLLVLDAGLAPLGAALFCVGDGDSWTATAKVIDRFRARRDDLLPAASLDPDLRICAYLHLAERTLRIRRNPDGRASLPYTAGFAPALLIAVAKRLSASGVLAGRPGLSDEPDARELEIVLTTKGRRMVLSEEALAGAAGGKVA